MRITSLHPIYMFLLKIKICAKNTSAQHVKYYNRKIIYSNRAFVELFGIYQTPEQLVYTNCIDL